MKKILFLSLFLLMAGSVMAQKMVIGSRVPDFKGVQWMTTMPHTSETPEAAPMLIEFYNPDNASSVRFFSKLAGVKERHPKSWFRAWFNMGLINYIEGGRRMLPCEAGSANFFIDPFGDVFPCNGLEEKYWKKSMGNIHETPDFMTIWESEQAQEVRAMVRRCPKNCWMVGTASPVMHKYIKYPLKWALINKLKSLQGKDICLEPKWCDVGQDPEQGDLREKF